MADSEQPGAAPAASSQSLGQLLREARVAKELTIDQLATGLRIDARQISALEEDRFEQIGVPVFVKGYIRQCAQRLGLDPHAHGLQTTKDGKFSVEFVECLAGCGMAPVMMCNEDFHEGVTNAKADEIMGGCK